jgi:hypothetical protein
MNCPDVKSVEEAELTTSFKDAQLLQQVLPAEGLRRDGEGVLTEDALKMIMDSFKSRGIDPMNQKAQILKELEMILCTANKQYKMLLEELFRRVHANEEVSKVFLTAILKKNLFMSDMITLSRYLIHTNVISTTETFIEGWQNTKSETWKTSTYMEAFQTELSQDRTMLEKKSYLELRQHMVEVTKEKNKAVSNYLGLYGFLNIVAVGLLLYIAGSTQ